MMELSEQIRFADIVERANWIIRDIRERDKYRAKAMSQYVISTNQERRRKI